MKGPSLLDILAELKAEDSAASTLPPHFDRTSTADFEKPETRMDSGLKAPSTASTAFTAPAPIETAIQAALFEPSRAGFIALEAPVFGRFIWTSREETLVPPEFRNLPRYSWPELERILDSGITQASLLDLHRIKAVLSGTVTEVKALSSTCGDCGSPIDIGALVCNPCFEARTARKKRR